MKNFHFMRLFNAVDHFEGDNMTKYALKLSENFEFNHYSF